MSRLIVKAGEKIKIGIGSYATVDWSISQKDFDAYANFVKDYNPIHFDPEAAKERGFKGPIVYGMMVASVLSNVIGNNFPRAIYMSQTVNFTAPVYKEEEIVAKVVIEELERTRKNKIKCLLDTTVMKKEENLFALEGKALILLDPEGYELTI